MPDLLDMFIYIQEKRIQIPTDSQMFDNMSFEPWLPIVE